MRELDVRGKVVVVRSDLNSDIVKGRVKKGQRIVEAMKTINLLKKKGARVVVLAHQGNPGKKDFYGLYQHAKFMKGVKFVDDVVGEKAVKSIKSLKNGKAILIDNVRFVEDEFKPRKKGNVFAKTILPLVDVYVNDAFSVSHRDHFSIVGFSRLKKKGIGLLFEKEIRALEKMKLKGAVYVLGGAKAESNVKLLGKKGTTVIACGLFGQMCLAARGFKFGYQNKFLKKAVLVKGGYDAFLKKLGKKIKGVEVPVDFAVEKDGKRFELDLDDFPSKLEIEDIGAESIERFGRILEKAKAVYVKGPAGWVEDKRFRKGTDALLKSVAKCKGFTLVGGGQLSEEIMRMPGRLRRKFDHVSLSGGACLAVVAGEKLVGLKALGYYR